MVTPTQKQHLTINMNRLNRFFNVFKPEVVEKEVIKETLVDLSTQASYRQMMNVATTYIDKKTEVLDGQASLRKKLIEYSDNTTKKTIQDWRWSLTSARDINRPNRYDLLDLFVELRLDPFLDSVVNFQKSKLTSINRLVRDENGKELVDETKLFNGAWFDQIISAYVDATLQGFNVLEIDSIIKDRGLFTINKITTIPSKNVIPEKQLIKQNQYSDSITYSYDGNDYIIEIIIDNNRNLGILSKLAPYLIYKKLAVNSWALFTENYSIPGLIIKTPIQNPDKELQLMNQLDNMGQAIKMVMDTNDEFEYLQPNSQDVYQTFKELIQMVNDQISNQVIGGTLLFSGGQGGSYALSNTHESVSALKTKADLKDIERFVNTYLIPQLKRLGLLKNENISFEFQYEEYLTMASRAEIDARMMPFYTFDKDYLEKTYKIKLDDTILPDTNP